MKEENNIEMIQKRRDKRREENIKKGGRYIHVCIYDVKYT